MPPLTPCPSRTDLLRECLEMPLILEEPCLVETLDFDFERETSFIVDRHPGDEEEDADLEDEVEDEVDDIDDDDDIDDIDDIDIDDDDFDDDEDDDLDLDDDEDEEEELDDIE